MLLPQIYSHLVRLSISHFCIFDWKYVSSKIFLGGIFATPPLHFEFFKHIFTSALKVSPISLRFWLICSWIIFVLACNSAKTTYGSSSPSLCSGWSKCKKMISIKNENQPQAIKTRNRNKDLNEDLPAIFVVVMEKKFVIYIFELNLWSAIFDQKYFFDCALRALYLVIDNLDNPQLIRTCIVMTVFHTKDAAHAPYCIICII